MDFPLILCHNEVVYPLFDLFTNLINPYRNYFFVCTCYFFVCTMLLQSFVEALRPLRRTMRLYLFVLTACDLEVNEWGFCVVFFCFGPIAVSYIKMLCKRLYIEVAAMPGSGSFVHKFTTLCCV